MKKAILAGLCFVLVSLLLVNGTFALPDLDQVFSYVAQLGDALGLPERGGAGTPVHVSLVSESTMQQLYPGGTVAGTTCVRNRGEGAVCFRLVYAVQYEAESWPKLDIGFDAGSGFIESDWQEIIIDSTAYRMKTFTYTETLPPGTDSPGVTLTIAMDSSVTSEQLSRYRSDFLQTQVLAIDPTPFAEIAPTAVQALDMALPLDSLNPF